MKFNKQNVIVKIIKLIYSKVVIFHVMSAQLILLRHAFRVLIRITDN